MKYAIVQFLLYEYLEESPNCVYVPNIYLFQQQEYTVIRLSDLAKNWHCCTHIIGIIFIPQPLDLKNKWYTKNLLKGIQLSDKFENSYLKILWVANENSVHLYALVSGTCVRVRVTRI